MKKLFYPFAIMAIVALSAFTYVNATSWKIADNYEIKFSAKDPKQGVFKSFKGDIQFDENDLNNSKFNVSIDPKSINTGNGLMNKKAKGADWFDADKYPTITYTSSSIKKTANGYEVDGTLDMHGVKKEVAIPFTFNNNTFKGSMHLKRTDFNIGATTGMSGHASIDFAVDITVPVTK